MYFEAVDFLDIFFILFIYNYIRVTKYENAAEIWPEVSAMDSLMPYPVWLEKTLALRAEYLSFAVRSLRLVGVAVRYDRLLVAQDTWAEADIALEDLLFHLFHALRRLYIPLMQLTIYYLGHLLYLLPHIRRKLPISFILIFNEHNCLFEYQTFLLYLFLRVLLTFSHHIFLILPGSHSISAAVVK